VAFQAYPTHGFRALSLRTTDADEVFVTPEWTYVLREADGVITRWRNGAEMRAALDDYLLTGRLPDTNTKYRLESPRSPETTT